MYLFDVREITLMELQKVVADLGLQQIKYLLVGNKTDMLDEQKARSKFEQVAGIIFISAKSGLHLEVLKEKLVDSVLQGNVQGDDAMVTNARHYHALKEVQQSLNDIKNGLDNQIASDLMALDIRRCLHYLGEITGEITNEDQLDYIFCKFCIGK